jgi:folylpolyglutamate synthase/dihydropteroate synthase
VEERAADKGAALMAADHRVVGPGVTAEIERFLGPGPFTPAGQLVALKRRAGERVRLAWDSGSVDLTMPFQGAHQQSNLQLAVALACSAHAAGWIDELRPDAVASGVAATSWPGRLSTHRIGGRRVLVDCAHNAEGAKALADHLGRSPVLYHLLFSCLADKPVDEMAGLLRPQVGNIVIFELDDDRAMPLDELQRAFPEAQQASSLADGLQRLPSPVVAAGSIRAVGGLLSMAEEEVGS